MRNESNKSRHDFDHTVIISKTSKVDKKDKLKLVRKKLRDEELADRKFEITKPLVQEFIEYADQKGIKFSYEEYRTVRDRFNNLKS